MGFWSPTGAVLLAINFLMGTLGVDFESAVAILFGLVVAVVVVKEVFFTKHDMT